MMSHRSGIASVIAVVGMALGGGPAASETLPRFPASSVWNQDISSAAVHPNSAAMIAAVAALGGFGNNRMQIDFSIHVVHAPPGSPTRTTVSHPWGYYDPDCEPLGTEIPVPTWAAIEGGTDLSCNNLDNDCHLLVVQGDTLYEAYLADFPTGRRWEEAAYWAARLRLELGQTTEARGHIERLQRDSPLTYYSVRASALVGEDFRLDVLGVSNEPAVPEPLDLPLLDQLEAKLEL